MLKKAVTPRVACKKKPAGNSHSSVATAGANAGKKKCAGVSQSCSWVMQIDNLDLKNDAAAIVAGPRQHGAAARARKTDALQPLLRRADAADWYGPLLRVGCSADALATGAITVKDLCMLTSPQMPLDKAAFILKAAADATFHAPGAAGGCELCVSWGVSFQRCARGRWRHVS